MNIPIEVEEMIAGMSLKWAEGVRWDDPGQEGIALVAFTHGAREMYSHVIGHEPPAPEQNEGVDQEKSPAA